MILNSTHVFWNLQVREHAVVESHPDNVLEDLRLDSPFDSLLDFLKEQNLETMSKNEYMHTPYLIILFKYLEMWRSQNDGKIPQNYKEKREFKDMILKSKSISGFVINIYLSYMAKAINEGFLCKEISQDSKGISLEQIIANFLIIGNGMDQV